MLTERVPLYKNIRLWLILNVSAIIVLAACLSGLGIRQIAQQRIEEEEKFRNRMTVESERVMKTMALSFYEYDRRALDQIISSFLMDDNAIYAVFLRDILGNLDFGLMRNGARLLPLTAPLDDLAVIQDRLLKKDLPISYRQNVLGTLLVYFSPRDMARRIDHYIQNTILLFQLFGFASLVLVNTGMGLALFLKELLDQQKIRLHQSESKFRTYIESSPTALFIIDAQGRYRFVNAAASQLTGYTREELLAMTIFELSDTAEPQARFAELRQSGRICVEIALKKKTGASAHVILDAIRIQASEYMGYCTDITGRKQIEEQLSQHNLLLQRAVQAKQQEMETLFERLLRHEKLATIGQMAGSIAHELRNPLGAVKQAAFYLQRLIQRGQFDLANPKVQEYLALIAAEIETSERVIAALLQMTRLAPMHHERILIRPLLQDAINRCALSQEIRINLDGVPEDLEIQADPLQLRQVFINLLTNAGQAITGVGDVTIRATPRPAEHMLELEMQDTGSGIPPQHLEVVFEPLFTTKATGTGLGLSVCKQIIENHQGEIRLRSQPAQGTTVTIRLPLEDGNRSDRQTEGR